MDAVAIQALVEEMMEHKGGHKKKMKNHRKNGKQKFGNVILGEELGSV